MNQTIKTELDGPKSFSNPVFAILTTIDSKGKLRGNKKNFIDIIKMGKEMGFVVYVLPIQNLNLQHQLQRGYVFNLTSLKWARKLMPFPNIMYNRIPFRTDENTAIVKNKLNACRKNPNTIIFNPYFFNKWELFQWLKEEASTKPYIPRTVRLNNSTKLEKLLEQHSYLYLKPESGKAGKGIMTIVKKDNSPLPFHLNMQQKTYSTSYSSTSFKKLWMRVQKEMGDTPYIAQRGISLATYYNRKFDLRALVQKNNSGSWEVTGLGARVAGSESITTHVPRGGSIDDPVKLLSHVFSKQDAYNIIERAQKAAILIATQIEKAANHSLAEMSMDIGVDKDGEIWVFEANSKPMKFDEPHIRKKSLQRIFQYSNYLLAR